MKLQKLSKKNRYLQLIILFLWETVTLVYESKQDCYEKKKNMNGNVKTTVKKYLAQVICNIGRSVLKYLANPSIIGNITHANKLKHMAFI